MATRGQSETAGRASVTTRVRVGPGLIGLRLASLRSALSDERVVMIAAFVVLRAVEIAHSPTSFPDLSPAELPRLPGAVVDCAARLHAVPDGRPARLCSV